ncbi:hypothetical protein XENOCAPTIV_005759 [Xenoophorus captivus]|uniref:Uncharacterized protein n=1 Tax=Xenoophorus captivus TaxID=1517983 RepID=A0ABV0RV63_9TELE
MRLPEQGYLIPQRHTHTASFSAHTHVETQTDKKSCQQNGHQGPLPDRGDLDDKPSAVRDCKTETRRNSRGGKLIKRLVNPNMFLNTSTTIHFVKTIKSTQEM